MKSTTNVPLAIPFGTVPPCEHYCNGGYRIAEGVATLSQHLSNYTVRKHITRALQHSWVATLPKCGLPAQPEIGLREIITAKRTTGGHFS